MGPNFYTKVGGKMIAAKGEQLVRRNEVPLFERCSKSYSGWNAVERGVVA